MATASAALCSAAASRVARGCRTLSAACWARRRSKRSKALGPFAGDPLGLAALGGELALELGPADRQRTLLGGRAALLDQPRGVALALERAGVVARGLAQRTLGLLAGAVGLVSVLLRALRRGARGVLDAGGAIDREDQLLALVAAGEHALGAPLGDLAHLPGGGKPHPPAGGDGDTREILREILQALQHPGVGEQPLGESEHRAGSAQKPDQGTRAGHRGLVWPCRRGFLRVGLQGGQQRGGAVRSRAVQQRRGALQVWDERRVQATPESSRERELVAGLDAQRVAQRTRPAHPGRSLARPAHPGGSLPRLARPGASLPRFALRGDGHGGVVAKELVDRRQLRADASRLPAGPLDLALGLAQGRACLLRASVGLLALLAGLDERGVQLRDLGGGPLAALVELRELALELLLALALQHGELLLERGDALADPRSIPLLPAREGLLEHVDLALDPVQALREALGGGGGLLAAQLQTLPRGTRVQGAAREGVVALGALGEGALGEGAALHDLLEIAFDLRPGRTRLPRRDLRLGELQAAGAQRIAGELQADLQHLALQALVELRGLRLALERAQTGARLALHVKRPVEVVLGALQLELGAAAAFAMLAQTRGLLDQEAAVARLGGHDRLDAALRDDRVGLLAQAGVGEQLEHVDEPAVGTVEPVLALTGAVVAAQDRELARGRRDRRVAVVEHELDLGLTARLHAAARRRRSHPASTGRARRAVTARRGPTARRR